MSVITQSVGKKGKNKRVDVITIQKLLHTNGYYPLSVTSQYGTTTVKAIKAFQRTFMTAPTGLIEPDSESESQLIMLNPIASAVGSMMGWKDFISGGKLAQAIRLSSTGPEVADMISSRGAWYPQNSGVRAMSVTDLQTAFGSFDFEATGVKDNIKFTRKDSDFIIVSETIPQLVGKPNSAGPSKDGKVNCHQKAAPRFVELFAAWEKAGLMDRVLDFSGPYNPRYKRKVTHDGRHSSLSVHTWGAAIDINVDYNQLKMPPARLGEKGCVLELVPIANALGFYWGGHFTGRLDGMHFEIGNA